jgi:hypothetical protein
MCITYSHHFKCGCYKLATGAGAVSICEPYRITCERLMEVYPFNDPEDYIKCTLAQFQFVEVDGTCSECHVMSLVDWNAPLDFNDTLNEVAAEEVRRVDQEEKTQFEAAALQVLMTKIAEIREATSSKVGGAI